MKTIFLGPSSLTRGPGIARPGPKTLAARLELTTLTPGSVALAAVVVSETVILRYQLADPPCIGTLYPLQGS